MVKNSTTTKIFVDFYGLKGLPWCTECNAKNLSSSLSTVSEKIKNNCQKCPPPQKKKIVFGDFLTFYLHFFRSRNSLKAEVFLHCVQCIKALLLLVSCRSLKLPSSIVQSSLTKSQTRGCIKYIGRSRDQILYSRYIFQTNYYLSTTPSVPGPG